MQYLNEKDLLKGRNKGPVFTGRWPYIVMVGAWLFGVIRDLSELVGLDDMYMALQLRFLHRSKRYIFEGLVSRFFGLGLAQ